MNELSATLGLSQLAKIEKMNNKRKRIAKIYHKELNVERKMEYSKSCVYHLYWICVKNRKLFRKSLSEKGIETGTHYKPIHQMSLYKKSIKLPNTEQISNEIVTIPIHPNLTENELDKIISMINKFDK